MIEDLYQEIILDHYRSPRNRGALDNADIRGHDDNPVCGDEITLFVRIDDDDRIDEITFDGHGCSISMASASMMTELLRGLPVPEAAAKIEDFRRMMRGETEPDPDTVADELGDIAALLGVRKFAVRVKCATLAWSTLARALEKRS